MLLENFYEVLLLKKEDENTLVASVKINKAHTVFKGHFPENPVTPGVTMLQILKNCLETYFEEKLLMQNISNVKFLALVNPDVNDILNFNIKIHSENKSITIKNHTSFKDGRSVLKCNATFVKYLHH